VGEHEDVGVVGRVVAPPAFPAFVGPSATHWAEHVAPEDPGANVVEAPRREIVVRACRSIPAVHLLEGARRQEPLVQVLAADAQRIFQALIGAGAETVERNREAAHAKSGHVDLLRSGQSAAELLIAFCNWLRP
jgi:hypothetical protein